jgi:predicted permease
MNLKLAVRSFLKSPFVTIVAVISLALGIGANAAIFSLFHQIVLRNLPVEQPGRIVNLTAPGPAQGSASCGNEGDCTSVFSYPMFRDLSKQQQVFTGIAAHVLFQGNFAFERETKSGWGLVVSGSYFPVLGLQPALGRLLGPIDDGTIGEPHALVLNYDYWQTRFGANPGVLNQIMTVNGQPMTIIGVAPRDFDGTTVGMKPEVFAPITMLGYMWPSFRAFEDRNSHWAYLFARLKPGVTIEQAAGSLNGPYRAIINDVEAPLQQMSPQTLARFREKRIKLEPGAHGQSDIRAQGTAPLQFLFALTALVLLIACANIANLLLARSAARAGEMAVRLSIGASRRQLMIQLLAESVLLAAVSGAAGLLVAQWTLALIASLVPPEAAVLRFTLETPVVLFAAALALGTGLLFGLFPAIYSTRPDLVSTLKGQSGQPGGNRGAARFRTALATSQIAFSMALLILAGLFTKSLSNVNQVKLGLEPGKVVTFRVSPALNGYTPVRSLALFNRIEEELRALPGVSSVTSSTVELLAGNNWGTGVAVEGFQSGPDVDNSSNYMLAGADYVHTLGIPLIAGRDISDSDTASRPRVAIVNEAFAKKFNLGRNPVGKHMRARSGKEQELDTEIIGLAQNFKYSDVKAEVPPVFFMPYRQNEGYSYSSMNYYIRTSLQLQRVLGAIAPVISRLDANLPIESLQTMPEQVLQTITVDRVISILSAAFAAVATILAAVGLYGVLAYTVAQRTREIGVRMALGAAPDRIRGMVLRQVGWMTVTGGTVGLAAALALGKFAESLLFQLNGHDPVVLASGACLLIVVSMGAGFIPAHRASRVDPMRALRYE